MRRLAVLVPLAVALAACGGGMKRIAADHATLLGVDVRARSVSFTFDVAPATVRTRYVPRSSLAECGSGRAVRPLGRAFLVVHFSPAQTQGVPYRVLTRPGPVLEAAKTCDFEADVAWAIGLDARHRAGVSRHGSTVTLTFR